MLHERALYCTLSCKELLLVIVSISALTTAINVNKVSTDGALVNEKDISPTATSPGFIEPIVHVFPTKEPFCKVEPIIVQLGS